MGSIYAIIALGYTMVYGIAKMLNFAHGDVIMVGAYICFYATSRFELPAIAGVLLAIVVCTILGIVIERLAYKPLRVAPHPGRAHHRHRCELLPPECGPAPVVLQPQGVFLCGAGGGVSLFGGQLTIPYVTLVTIAACIVIVLVLVWFTGKTKMGKAMRACSEDKGARPAHGHQRQRHHLPDLRHRLRPGRHRRRALLCSAYPTLVPTTGAMPGIKAFTAAVFGGIGSIPGAMLGGVLLGIIEIFAKAYISTQLSDAIVFAVLIVVLVVRPAGLLGKQVREKV